jgi:cytochrome c oxidase subunit 2
VGPTWQGLAGSSVELEDGTTVVADSAYLERAIVEPQSEVAKGYTIAMPKVNLTVDEVAAIITYIEELK